MSRCPTHGLLHAGKPLASVQMTSAETSSGTRKRKYQPDRFEYLDQLVIEFQTTKSKDAREQVLANLANFAFDPINYDHFRQLQILDIFLNNLSNPDENLIKFSIGGLCNLCLDPVNKVYINEHGLKKVIKLLELSNEDILLSTMTTLMFLMTPESKAEITSPAVIETALQLSKKENFRLKHVATIFLEDYCSEEQLKQCLQASAAVGVLKPES